MRRCRWCFFFGGEQGGEQRLGSERGFYGEDGVEEIGLLDRSQRRGFVGAGDCREARTGESATTSLSPASRYVRRSPRLLPMAM